VRWTPANLRSGDEILLKIVDRKSVEKYKVIRRHDEKRDLESMERNVRERAKALGLELRKKRRA
jgi:ribosomal silencing factor RsfS